MKDQFKLAEDEYFVLRGKSQVGRITPQEFDAALKKLVVQDAQGRQWTIAADTGRWRLFDGQNWVEATPSSGEQDLPPTTLPGQFTQSKPYVAPRGGNNALRFALGGVVAACILLMLVLGGAAAFGIIKLGPAVSGSIASSNVPGVKAAVIPVASPSPIAAKDFAKLNASLADKIAVLNQSQLKFIRDMRASSRNNRITGLAILPDLAPAMTDEDLKDLAGKAMDVAILTDQLSELSGKQDGGSNRASQSADDYAAIARNAYSLVVDSQNVRQALLNNLMTPAQAIETIAQYGAQLWNSAVTDGSSKGNPFTSQTKNVEPVQSLNPAAASQVQSQVNAGNSSIWIAQSGTQTKRTLDLPAGPLFAGDPFDMLLKNSMTTSAGQNDGAKAQQVAVSNLQKLGATTSSSDPSKPTQVQVPTSPVAVSGGEQIKTGNIPTFKSGKATVVSKNNPTDDNPFIQALGLNGDQPPTDQGKTTVKDEPSLVNLSITNIVINSVNKRSKDAFTTFEADVTYEFTVNWNTRLKSPQFEMDCASGNHYNITAAGGSQHVSAKGLLILFPGAEDAYCYASHNGITWGSASVHFLVGDAGEATKRAIQVETDSVALDATLTADARNTQSVQQTRVAETAQANATSNAVATEVAGTRAAEFKITAAAAETIRLRPPPPSTTPLPTPTFAPKVVDQLTHPGNVEAVSTHIVLQRGRLYRFSFSGRVNVINPRRSLSASQLPDRVNGVAVPASGVLVIQGTGGVATITCGHEVPDPNDPGAYGIVVEDLGPS